MTDKPKGNWEDEVHEDYSENELHQQPPPDPEMTRDLLYKSGFLEHRNLPELAQLWLSELAGVGLRESDPIRQAHFSL